MRVVIAADCAPLPWANGGGVTRDLALEPAAVEAEPGGPSFDWRLSLADIDRDGPFSALSGVDRVFAVVEGSLVLGFEARAAGRGGQAACGAGVACVDAPASPDAAPRADADTRAGSIACDAAGDPLAFAGEAAPRAALAEGARCRALNLMLARGRRAGAMRRVVLADGATLEAGWSRGGTEAGTGAGAGTGTGTAVRACWVQRGRIAAGERVIEAGALLVLDAGDPDPLAIGEALMLEVAIGPPVPFDASMRDPRRVADPRAAAGSPPAARSLSAGDPSSGPTADDPRPPR